MARDNFSTKVIRQLRTRVAHRCSNPECRVPTVAAGVRPDAVTSIGVAAHIHAASVGGPRYCAEMTTQERTSIENGIWLCSACSIKIDRDVERYSAELLREWRVKADDQAVQELGKPLPSANDARDQITMTLTGLPMSFAPTAIQNVHAASALALEKLDPRFHVETSHHHRTTTFTLHAKENVPMSFIIDTGANAECKAQLSAMLDHGQIARVGANGVSLKGSPLFEQALSSSMLAGGEFVFKPKGKPVVAKLSLFDDVTQQVIALDDIHGLMAVGRKSLTFKGSGYGNLLTLTIYVPVASEATGDASFTLETDLERWVGRDVRTLPYFDKIADLYQRLMQGWAADVRLEFEGAMLLGGRISRGQTHPLVVNVHTILEYTRRARVFASRLDKDISFQLSPFTAADHERLAETARILDGKEVYSHDGVNGVTCTLIATTDGANIRLLHEQLVPSEVIFVHQATEPLEVFGQPVGLPDLKTTLSGVLPKFLDDVSNIKEGDIVRIEWMPADDFQLSRMFVI